MFDKEETDSAENLKPVSVVIISDNNSVELDNNLKYFLSQDYSAGYEIIVVVSRDEDGTADVLKRTISIKTYILHLYQKHLGI